MELAWPVTGTPAGIAAAESTKVVSSTATAAVAKATSGIATAALATTAATERDAASFVGTVTTAGSPAAGAGTTKAAAGPATAAAAWTARCRAKSWVDSKCSGEQSGLGESWRSCLYWKRKHQVVQLLEGKSSEMDHSTKRMIGFSPCLHHVVKGGFTILG